MGMINSKECLERSTAFIHAAVKLAGAEPCPIHGKEHLKICEHCLEEIQCTECEPIPCQCWNDE
jgi:hypothetical protein